MHNHHVSSRPPSHQAPPPSQPPAPPPPEAFSSEAAEGKPRCYYCGQLIPREEDVRKTDHRLGAGYSTMVMICPACLVLKERGEGPWAGGKNQRILGIIMVCLGVVAGLIWLLTEPGPGQLGMSEGRMFLSAFGPMCLLFGLVLIFAKPSFDPGK